MPENLTLEAYEHVIKQAEVLKNFYENFDHKYQDTLRVLKEEGERENITWLLEKTLPELAGILSYTRGRIYRNTQKMIEDSVWRYKRLCQMVEAQPQAFSISFETFQSGNLDTATHGPSRLNSRAAAANLCHEAWANVKEQYVNMSSAFQNYEKAYQNNRENLVREDVREMDSLLDQVRTATKNIEPIVNNVVTLLQKFETRFRENG